VRFVVDKVAMGQVFSEYFGFPCQFSFHGLLHTHHLSSGAGTIGQLVADVPSGPHPKKLKNLLRLFTLKFYTTCFDQCGHHQVLKIMDEETAVFRMVASVVNI
jgi:hypothetical protein